MLIFLYQFLSIIFFPLIKLYIFFRILRKKENVKRISEKFGRSSIKITNKKNIIWVHAVSVGEMNSAIVLVESLIKENQENLILFTTTTITSAEILSKKIIEFNGKVIHQFLPIDSYFCVAKFLNFWQPEKIIFIESEIWPNFLYQAFQREIPTFLVNARISDRSLKRWQFAKKIGFNIFDYFDKIFAQTSDDKKKLSTLTFRPVFCYGNLKSQTKDLKIDLEKLAEIKFSIKNRPIFLATSTHRGEEKIVIDCHHYLRKKFSNLLTIIVPRHPIRAEEIKILFKDSSFSQHSKNQKIEDETEFYLVDSFGELGIFYSLVDFAFIGGSLEKIGGHNPFEAIRLDCGIISGREVFNFKEIYQKLAENNACFLVNCKEELIEMVEKLITDQSITHSVKIRAKEVLRNSENISEKIVKEIFSFYF
jgi:3-deoxy-D-manno-octulosonic-acid transferase